MLMNRLRCLLKRLLPWVLCLCPALFAGLLFVLLREFPAVAEYGFSRGVFRVISTPLAFLSSLYPWSFAELLAVSAIPLLVLLAVLLVRRLRRSPHRAKTAAHAVRAAAMAVSCVLLLYMLMHGVNYYREPLSELMALDTETTCSAAYLKAVCSDLAQQANAAREPLTEDADGCVTLSKPLSKVLLNTGAGYKVLQQDWPFLWSAVWRIKPVHLSHWWSYTGTTGVYFPLLGEANVNTDMPVWAIPTTAAHEMAHTIGFAREDECNFLAFLSCRNSPDPDYVYSGYLMAYIQCGNALYHCDKDGWREVREQCSAGVLRDLQQQNTYWDSFEGKVQEVSSAANDAFIRAQGVEEGIVSYDRVVALIVAWYEKTGFPG